MTDMLAFWRRFVLDGHVVTYVDGQIDSHTSKDTLAPPLGWQDGTLSGTEGRQDPQVSIAHNSR